MEKFEKVIHILEREVIPYEEKEYLKRIANEDIDIKNFISVHLKLKRIFNSSSHLDMEILAEFILYYDGDLNAAEYIPEITDKIEDHLTECSVCNNLYLAFTKELQQVDDFVSEAINDNGDFEFQKKPSVFSRIRKTNFRAALTAFILLLITYFGMMITSYYNTPSYKKNIFEFEAINNSLIHNRTTDLFIQGLTAFNKEDFDRAIDLLLKDIILNQNDSTIYYSNYLLGITYLKSSENNILGTFKSYDHLRINEGIENLMVFIDEKSEIDVDDRSIIDTHYFIAKAYLSIDAIEEAKKHLQIVREKRGKYYSDAVGILNVFENDEQIKSVNN
jgi:tetratricopeptide (TPR) repeat protein